jgi:medium-chain acyl-[acyl-carrier-protein] hydrolase
VNAEEHSGRIAVCLNRNAAARVRLYCFPYAGGATWAFSSWVRDLPLDVRRDSEVWAVNLPGRESGLEVSPFTEFAALIDALRQGIVPHLNPPYVFFGHSMGALIGFELARRLHADGLAGPAHLVVSAYRAPQLPDRHGLVDELSDERMVARLRALGGVADGALDNAELRDLKLPVIRSDLALCGTYVYEEREPLPCSLSAFGGTEDPEVSREEIIAWHVHTQAEFAARMFPGGHFFLESVRPLVLRVLGRELRQVLLRERAAARIPAV